MRRWRSGCPRCTAAADVEEETMRRGLVTAMAVLLATLTAAAAPTVTGDWRMKVEGGPHGDATMALSLKQDGDKVTGTFASGHTADMAVAGTFEKGKLKIET